MNYQDNPSESQSEYFGHGGATRKVADLPGYCNHPEHNPPSHRVFEPGVYEHTCPGCRRKQTFTVGAVMC